MDQEKIPRKESYDSTSETIDDMPCTPYIKYSFPSFRPLDTPELVLPELTLPEAFALDEISDCSHYDNTEAYLDCQSSWFEVMLSDKKLHPQYRVYDKMINLYPTNLLQGSMMKMGLVPANSIFAGQSKVKEFRF